MVDEMGARALGLRCIERKCVRGRGVSAQRVVCMYDRGSEASGVK